MADLLTGMAVFLLINVFIGLFRIIRGPSHIDRMLAAQLLGTMGISVTLLLGESMEVEALFDLALVFAVLAPLAAAFFVRRFRHGKRGDHD